MHKKRVYHKEYFYTTIRDKEKTKSVYLGDNYKKAKLKEAELKRNHHQINAKSFLDIKLPKLYTTLLMIILIAIFILIFLNLRYTGFTILRQFNTSNIEINLSFSDITTENLTKYLDLYKYINVTYAYLNLTGYEYWGNRSDTLVIYTAGAGSPAGIKMNGSDFWVLDSNDHFVYHFNSAGVNQSDGFNVDSAGAASSEGITTNNSDFWVLDSNDHFVYHFNSAGVNQSDGFNIGNAGATDGLDIDTNGSDFWVLDAGDYFVYHFNSSGANQSDGFPIIATSPIGLTTNGSDFWIVNSIVNRYVYHYNKTGSYIGIEFNINELFNRNNHNWKMWGVTTNTSDFWVLSTDIMMQQPARVFHFTKDKPSNPFLDIGEDYSQEWSHSGQFLLENNKTTDLASTINAYLFSCTPNSYGNCSVPLLFHSDTSGKIKVNDLNIQYNSSPIVTSVGITPTLPEVEDNLNCASGGSSDPDGDSYNLIYDFGGSKGGYTLLNIPFDRYARDVSQYRNTYATTSGGFLARNGTYISNGKLGGAWLFDGIDDYLNFSTDVTHGNYNKLTMETWVNLTANLAATEVLNDGTTIRGISLVTNDGNNNLNFRLRFSPPGGAFSIEKNLTYSNAGLTLNHWHHLAGVWNGEEGYARLYLDGTLINSTTDTLSNISNPLGAFYIGINDLLNVYLNGTLDEARVYNDSLSSAQILAHYNLNYSELQSPETGIVGEEWFCSITPIDINGILGATSNSTKITIQDTSIPTVILNPAINTAISLGGSLAISCTGNDNYLMQSLTLTLDGSNLGSCSTNFCSGTAPMPTTTPRTVLCTATDTSGNSASSSIILSESAGGGSSGGGGGGTEPGVEPPIVPIVPPAEAPPEELPAEQPIEETPADIIPLIVPQAEITSWVSAGVATVDIGTLAKLIYSYIDVGGVKKPKVDISFSQKDLREIKGPITIKYINYLKYVIIILSFLIMLLLVINLYKIRNQKI